MTTSDVRTTADGRSRRVRRSTRFKVLWTIWMAGGGLAAAAIVYKLTSSWWWTLGALLASGVVLNAIGQVITQPGRAVSASRQRPADLRPHRARRPARRG
jgi:hypothetical protein